MIFRSHLYSKDVGAVGLVGKAFASQLGGRGFDPQPGQTEDLRMGTLLAASLNASIMRLVPGLVSSVSMTV